MDGVEFESFGHLLSQFWSPMSNHLDNAYGGSLENRMRFSLEVLAAVRARVGPQFILGVRYVVDELSTAGYDKAEGLEISRILKDSGLIDFLNVSRGHIETDAGLTDNIRNALPRVPRNPNPGRGHRAPCGGIRQGRHDRHDPRPHGGSAHHAQDPGEARA